MRLLLSILIWLFALDVAGAHSFYPNECCNEGDCRPISCADLSNETRLNAHGFSIEIIVYSNNGKRYYAMRNKVRASPDERCHACFWAGTLNMRCIWTPQRTS